MFSIVIPAHNEASVVAENLSALTEGLSATEAEVLLVCNGCTDATAINARAVDAENLRVIEIDTASKVAALNAGDAVASGYPRIYLDADVRLTAAGVRQIAEALDCSAKLAASPRAVTEWQASSWPVRSFYKVWTGTSYFRAGMIGCGVYALNEEGRSRFAAFPNVIADDGYVRALFAESERLVVQDVEVVVQAPRTLRSLILAKTRVRLGRYELKKRYPALVSRERGEKSYGSVLLSALRKPLTWPAWGIYIYVNLRTRTRARKQIGMLTEYRWERDESTRSGVGQ